MNVARETEMDPLFSLSGSNSRPWKEEEEEEELNLKTDVEVRYEIDFVSFAFTFLSSLFPYLSGSQKKMAKHVTDSPHLLTVAHSPDLILENTSTYGCGWTCNNQIRESF